MGEKDGVKKVAAAAAESVTVVLKVDLHCEGCAKKVRRAVSHFEGVEKVKADWAVNKLTVTGNVDPEWLRERVEHKTKKKVDLISPQPKNDGAHAVSGGGDKKSDEKPDKKTGEKKAGDKKSEQPAGVSTVVMKFKLHCDGCAHKVKRVILKNIGGVESVTTDLERDLVTVMGTMNVKELTAYLQEKLRRSIEIVPPSGKKEGGGDQPKTTSSGGVEVNKMEYHRLDPETHYAMPLKYYYNQSCANGLPVYHPPPPMHVNIDDQMFSDENPNGCSVM